MIIRFCKGDNKRDTLVCVRDDGTSTWSKLTDRFVYHDIVHYVVESTLGYRDAFYGLIARGMDIAVFTEIDPATGMRPAWPPEAMQAEGIVGILQSQSWNGASNEDVLALIAMACVSNGVTVEGVTSEQLDIMRTKIGDYWRLWEQLPMGKALEVWFP